MGYHYNLNILQELFMPAVLVKLLSELSMVFELNVLNKMFCCHIIN